MWEAWSLATQWNTRPSELYGIREELAAYNFDRAVMHFGKHVEAEMHAAAEKAKTGKAATAKAQQVLNKYLTDPAKGPQFRDPMAGRKSGETFNG